MRRILHYTLYPLLLFSLIGCTQPSTTDEPLQEEEQTTTSEETLEVSIGETFSITLDSNPTTGYSWTAEYEESSVDLIEDTFTPPEDTGRVGAGGEQTFTFEALSAGSTTVTLKYMRPWESVQPIETRTYTITVEE